MFHTINIDDMGTEAKENLSTGESMEDALDIGKERISGYHFIEPSSIQVCDPGLDVSPHGISNDHFSQLGSVLDGGLNDRDRSIS